MRIPRRKKALGHGSNADSTNSTTFSELFDLEANLGDAFCLVDETHFVCAMGPDGRRQFRFTNKLDPLHSQRYAWPRLPYIQVLLKHAYELQKRLEASPGLTQTALAEELGMSRVQVTQILGLLRLAPEIQQNILCLSPADASHPIPKHALMRLSGNPDHQTELKEFKRLLASASAVA